MKCHKRFEYCSNAVSTVRDPGNPEESQEVAAPRDQTSHEIHLLRMLGMFKVAKVFLAFFPMETWKQIPGKWDAITYVWWNKHFPCNTIHIYIWFYRNYIYIYNSIDAACLRVIVKENFRPSRIFGPTNSLWFSHPYYPRIWPSRGNLLLYLNKNLLHSRLTTMF